MLQKNPIDVSTFHIMRKNKYLYVDKTEYAYNFITGGRRFFLARPRRCGKSLFISTLQEILTSNKQIFYGLWIAKSDYTWEEYGMISLDFSAWAANDAASLVDSLKNVLLKIAKQYAIEIESTISSPAIILRRLVKRLHAKFGKVALLVDEYDSPVLQTHLTKDTTEAIHSEIESFFYAVKSLDAELDFVFVTGISDNTKMSFWGAMNNFRMVDETELP